VCRWFESSSGSQIVSKGLRATAGLLFFCIRTFVFLWERPPAANLRCAEPVRRGNMRILFTQGDWLACITSCSLIAMAIISMIESIRQAALQLHPDARVQLTHSLVQSLGDLPKAEIAQLWLAEAARRDVEMESGQIAGIPGDEVFERIQARHAK
jgi:putative addiction module component (TIGR02574 family)